MKNLWIVPCRYSVNAPIYDCINSIKNNHESDDICVVDSCSEDTTYLQNLNVNFFIKRNKNYVWGALVKAKKEIDFSKYGRICLIHDSVTIKKNINEIIYKSPITSLQWFKSWKAPGGTHDGYGFTTLQDMEWAMDEFKRLGIPWDEYGFWGLFGSIIFSEPKVIEELYELKINQILPDHKMRCTAMERILGYALTSKLGYDIVNNSFLGDHFRFVWENEYLRKVRLARH